MEYCTYLTVYSGNKMPIFYIGYSSVEKVLNGYRGSVSSKKYKHIWLEELQNNAHLFKTKILTRHTSRKEAAEKEATLHKSLCVHKNELYINQVAGYGTFHYDCTGKNNYWYGKSRSGKDNPMFGRTHKESSREKMSKSGIGKHAQPKTEEFKKTMREHYVGKTFEERFGTEYAEQIKQKLRKPKTEEHKKNIRNNSYHASRPKFMCVHCQKEIAACNLKRWHGDNCKLFTSLSLDTFL